MVSADNLTVSFGGFTLFDNISFMVNENDRIGLVGKNGAGKSTLLKIFMGLQQPTSGKVSIPNDFVMGYLPQQMSMAEGKTVFDEAMTAFEQINRLEAELDRLSTELSLRTDYESKEYSEIINSLHETSERLRILGGDSKEGNTEQTLLGLGFRREDFHKATSVFSGGWRMRIELAKILLAKPQMLLLDEPTNHLDIESIQWLEAYLKSSGTALILISHDRAFLDGVTNRTIEISLGKAYDYRVSYSKYVELRAERREQQTAAYENQRKMIEKTEDFIERFRYKASKSNQVQSRIKQLEKLDVIEIENEDLARLNIKFPPAPRSGGVVFRAKDLLKRYGEKQIFSEANIIVERGEKVAFVGRNGEGKTTMAKIIVGDTDSQSGEAIVGYNVKIGYYAQNQDELDEGEYTVLETLDNVATGEIRTKLRDILGAFLFRGEDVDKKVKVLSGGERSRLAMARLMLEPYNLLVLDEPTNHMDMRSKDILKNALKAYDGSLIVVSHDREFLDGLVNKVYEFRDGKVKEHLGGIYEFLERRKLETLNELERKSKVESTAKKIKPVQPSDTEKKERDRLYKKSEKELKELEESIIALESKIATMNATLSSPTADLTMDNAFYAEYEHTKSLLDKAMTRWEELLLIVEKNSS
ncbi:MAG: ATP-binding cassette domain-containing protein [Prevotellaceae bacterium]|nr:ATP-binding cassette domain-containing protein [Prevotellaceae bacterium]